MTNQEKQERIDALRGRQLELLSEMNRSDAHALKCCKLGLSYAATYPEEAAAYAAAREEYNANEQALAQTEAAETEEEGEPDI